MAMVNFHKLVDVFFYNDNMAAMTMSQKSIDIYEDISASNFLISPLLKKKIEEPAFNLLHISFSLKVKFHTHNYWACTFKYY